MTQASRRSLPPMMRPAFACARALLRRATAGSIAARASLVLLAVVATAALAATTNRTLYVLITPPAHPARSLDPAPLLVALDLFQRAVEDRVAGDSDAARAELDQSALNLDRATEAIRVRANAPPGTPEAGLASSINGYRVRGKELVSTSDQLRTALTSYGALLQSLTARVSQSIDETDTLFGRLFAQPALLELHIDLDAIARDAPLVMAPPGDSGATVLAAGAAAAANTLPAGMPSTEQRALSSLEAYEGSLARYRGDAWYEAMHDDLLRLVTLRGTILTLNSQLRARTRAFSDQSLAIAAVIPHELELPQLVARTSDVPRAQRPPPPTATSAIAGSQRPQIVPPPPTAAVRPAVPAPPTAVQSAGARSHRWSAWITLAAVLLLVCLLIGTAVGIVLPVRRLIRATKQLAEGDDQVQVARGGLKELDRLVVAFNTMASRLAIAKAEARDCENQFRSTIAAQTQRLEELAKRDPLTGLDNRRELLARLHAAIERAQATSQLVGVLFLDIDNFKYVNDSMGHLFGDRMLISLSQRLQEITQAFGHTGRLGGDEFTVIIDRAHGIDDIQAAGTAVLQAFQEPLTVDGHEISASVSVGASVYPYHARDAAALLQAADAALFRAKALGRSKLSLYTAELAELGAARMTTEQGLRRAIERGEFELVFQPEVSAATLGVAVVEALIRWRMPDGSLLVPEQFLSIAEDSGLIVDISNWVLQAAVEAAARWHHGAWPEVRVAINVSPKQLLDQRFVDRLQGLLQEHRLPTRCIEIELTESVLQTGPATIEALKRLRAKGVAIALDDFGTGYSSFASLERLPLTRVKLDRSLIASIDVSPRSAAIARGIISMCQGLGLEITAEGVERTAQLALLVGHRLMYLQGYLFARPVAREELMPLLSKVTERAQALVVSSQLLTPPNAGPSPNVVELATSSVRRPG
jgi:diguanylate cyclase (GGDEF)-like protein